MGAISVVHNLLSHMMRIPYKLICWSIWISGCFCIAISLYANKTFTTGFTNNLLVGTLFSSIPFAVIAIIAKKTFESLTMDSYHKNIRFSGVAVSFVLTFLFAIWSFSSPMGDALNPAGFFWLLSFATIFTGFITGALSYVLITKLRGKAKNISQKE